MSEEFLRGFQDGFKLISCRIGKPYSVEQTMDYGDGRRLGREYNQKCRNLSQAGIPREVAMWEPVYQALTNFFDGNDG